MIKQKYKKNAKLIKKIRKRYHIKRSVSLSREKKYIVYVQTTNNHIHISLVNDGKTIINSNSVKYKNKEESKVAVYKLIPEITKNFISKLKINFPTIKASQLVFDIYHKRYKGNIKLCIDSIRENLIIK